jgi:uncharacterized protein
VDSKNLAKKARNRRIVITDFTDFKAVESCYLETREGLFFAVKGFEHPPDRWIAVLRYAPDPEAGTRQKNGRSFRRLYHFAEQEQFLRTSYPQYLAYDPVFQTTMQSVPGNRVQRIYDPIRRLRELARARPGQGIEEDTAAFADLLQREAGVPASALGVTGSLLIGLHTESSDLDIVAYGMQNCIMIHHALHRLLDGQVHRDLRRLDAKGVEELYAQRVTDTHMAFPEFVNLEKRKVNQGSFRGRPYFIRFIKTPSEAGEIYGDRTYVPLGRAAVAGSVIDDREAIFTPCRYVLSDVRCLEGLSVSDLDEVVSFRGRFCEQARTGESVMAAGTLELVQDNRGNVRHRLLLGNSSQDTLVVRR